MRDSLCDEEHLRKMLVFNESLIKGDYEKIEMLKDDIAKGIQRYPLPPGKVIDNIRRGMVRKIRDLISNKYSLGLPCDELEDLYEQWVSLLQEVDFGAEGFLNWIKYFSLGILLEVPRETMQILVDLLDDAKGDDILLEVAKILQLDDSGLVHSNHYPYDLVHYKNSMQFNPDAIDEIMEGTPAKDKFRDLQEGFHHINAIDLFLGKEKIGN